MAKKGHLAELKSSEAHVNGEGNGCVFRCQREGHFHRENGYNYADASLKTLYNKDFTQGSERACFDAILGPRYFAGSQKRDPRHSARAWFIGSGPYGHLNYKSGWWPFGNQAHHILPVGAVTDSFTVRELKWLLQCKYNINKGLNIIILPQRLEVAEVMKLPNHCGSHPDYNADVSTLIDDIKSKFSQAKDPESKDHEPLEEENMPNVKADLEQWSKDEMGTILLEGALGDPKSVNEVAVFNSIRDG